MSNDDSPRRDLRLSGGKTLDRHDISILSALNSDPRMPASELGELVHLSRTAVSRRLAALREAGVFDGTPRIVSYEALGFSVRAFVEVSPKRNLTVDHVKSSLLTHPEVLEVCIVAGSSLFLVDVIAVDIAHLDTLVGSLQELGDTETKIVFSRTMSAFTLADRLELLRLAGQ